MKPTGLSAINTDFSVGTSGTSGNVSALAPAPAPAADDDWWAQAEMVLSPRTPVAHRAIHRSHTHHHDDSSDDEDAPVSPNDGPMPVSSSSGVEGLKSTAPTGTTFQHAERSVFFDGPDADEHAATGMISPAAAHLPDVHLPATPMAAPRSVNLASGAPLLESMADKLNALHTAIEEPLTHECEGLLWLRSNMLGPLARRWVPRYVVLRRGQLRVYASRNARLEAADLPLEVVGIGPNMALSQVKTGGNPRIYYRHIAAHADGSEYGASQLGNGSLAGQSRVFKFGCSSNEDLTSWSHSIQATIKLALRRAERAARDADLVKEGTSASEAFADTIRTPVPGSAGMCPDDGLDDGSGDPRTLMLKLLDGTRVTIPVEQGSTVKDVCVAMRSKIGLHADADYAVFLRTVDSGGLTATWPCFQCMPDIMPCSELRAFASSDKHDLVYKRRVYLPALAALTPSVRHGAKPEAFGAASEDDCDTEAMKATDANAGALRLLFIETAYHVRTGSYRLGLRTALEAAGCIAAGCDVPELGMWDESKHADVNVYRRHLATLLSAGSAVEWGHLHGTVHAADGVRGLLAAVQSAHKATAGMTRAQVRKQLVALTQDLNEFGNSFYAAHLLRHPAESLLDGGSSRAPATPAWAVEVTTTRHAHETELEPLPVIVAVGAHGVLTRPAPPAWDAGVDWLAYVDRAAAALDAQPGADSEGGLAAAWKLAGVRTAAAQGLGTGAQHIVSTLHAHGEGRTVPWMRHSIASIEVWGVKKLRPVMSYRVRERQLTLVELRSSAFKEIAATLHALVYLLLAAKEAKPRANRRTGTGDFGAAAHAAKAAISMARELAGIEGKGQPTGGDLPGGWSEVRDPITGATAFWNAETRRIVWARPE